MYGPHKCSVPEKFPHKCVHGIMLTYYLGKLYTRPTLHTGRKNNISTMHECYGGAVDNALKDQQVSNCSITLALIRVSLMNAL